MKAPLTMTRRRRLVATSHDGRYAYYSDVKDRYVYQFRLADCVWIGWLCSLAAWESAFSKSSAFEVYHA